MIFLCIFDLANISYHQVSTVHLPFLKAVTAPCCHANARPPHCDSLPHLAAERLPNGCYTNSKSESEREREKHTITAFHTYFYFVLFASSFVVNLSYIAHTARL